MTNSSETRNPLLKKKEKRTEGNNRNSIRRN